MRSLFFKVFIIFWIAQSLIFVISTALIVQRHFNESPPDVLSDGLSSTLQNDANHAIAAYESGDCPALKAYGAEIGQTIGLEDPSGNPLCPSAVSVPPPPTASDTNPQQRTPRYGGVQVGQLYAWRVPVIASNGKSYLFVLLRPHTPHNRSWQQDLLRFSFPQLPVAIGVGGLTTLVLVMLFTRPIVQLRKTARELARGKLNARVQWAPAQSRMFADDEISALIHDFNHMAERLESLLDAQKLLLRDVSHELRSPLARLSVALELAREDADPATSAHLERIEREAGALNQLIGQLLTLSSMEALERVENLAPLALDRLLERMIPDAEFEAQQRQCTVSFRAEEPCMILGNEELLYRAIENVVRNAIRYTESGTEVEIVLNVASSQTARRALIEVSDRGPGIPENQLTAIFRPFYRVDYARSPKTGGFGVGLAIAERAVRLHKGELSAANRVGGGVTFRISVPAL